MHTFFDADSWLFQLLSRFSSLVVLNLLFLFTCIPVFTMGAALTALYDVVFRMDTPREGKTASAYFRAFRANFKQSTRVFLIIALILAAGCTNIVLLSGMTGPGTAVLSVICVVILVNCILISGYAFPLISQFHNTTGNILKNSLLLTAANLPRTLICAGINCFPWMLMAVNFYSFIQLSFLWFALYFAAAAYFNSRVLMKLFDSLRRQASKAEETQ